MINEIMTKEHTCGYLEVILGPMFSGKTSRLINLYKQYTYCDIPVLVVNHSDDKRYDQLLLSNHDNQKIKCYQCESIVDMMIKYKNIIENQFTVILINEGQFFDDLYVCVNKLVNEYRNCVYVCGLDGDFKANKFGQMLDLIPICDKVHKLHSICAKCKNGKKAIFTNRKTHESTQKIIGVDTYEPLCRSCYNMKEYPRLSLQIPNDHLDDSVFTIPTAPRVYSERSETF